MSLYSVEYSWIGRKYLKRPSIFVLSSEHKHGSNWCPLPTPMFVQYPSISVIRLCCLTWVMGIIKLVMRTSSDNNEFYGKLQNVFSASIYRILNISRNVLQKCKIGFPCDYFSSFLQPIKINLINSRERRCDLQTNLLYCPMAFTILNSQLARNRTDKPA